MLQTLQYQKVIFTLIISSDTNWNSQVLLPGLSFADAGTVVLPQPLSCITFKISRWQFTHSNNIKQTHANCIEHYYSHDNIIRLAPAPTMSCCVVSFLRVCKITVPRVYNGLSISSCILNIRTYMLVLRKKMMSRFQGCNDFKGDRTPFKVLLKRQ